MSRSLADHGNPPLGWKDLAEIVIGSCVLGFPVAVTEEVWNLGETLPTWRVVVISALSIAAISGFIYFKYHRGAAQPERQQLYLRVAMVYSITLVVSAVLVSMIGKGPWIAEPIVALKRTMLVAFPASFSATVVDSLS
jgi:uncharacterized membrane protein